jgi:hypothetical protein
MELKVNNKSKYTEAQKRAITKYRTENRADLNEYSLQNYHKNKLDPEFKQRRSQANKRAYLKSKQGKLKQNIECDAPMETEKLIDSNPWRNSFRAVDDARMMEHYGITEPEIYQIFKLQLLREELKLRNISS